MNTNTNTITADPRFARLLAELDADVIDDDLIVTDTGELEIARHDGGWVVRTEDGTIVSPVLTKWECAFLVRDWDGEAPELVAPEAGERKIHA